MFGDKAFSASAPPLSGIHFNFLKKKKKNTYYTYTTYITAEITVFKNNQNTIPQKENWGFRQSLLPVAPPAHLHS